MDVYVADRFGGWHAKVLACLAGMFDEASRSFPADALQQVSGGDRRLAPGVASVPHGCACVRLHTLALFGTCRCWPR